MPSGSCWPPECKYARMEGAPENLRKVTTNSPTRPLLSDPAQGGGGCLGPWPAPADARTHLRKIFLRQKFIRRKFEANFRYTNFLLASDLPPPPAGGVFCPLSNGLSTATCPIYSLLEVCTMFCQKTSRQYNSWKIYGFLRNFFFKPC